MTSEMGPYKVVVGPRARRDWESLAADEKAAFRETVTALRAGRHRVHVLERRGGAEYYFRVTEELWGVAHRVKEGVLGFVAVADAVPREPVGRRLIRRYPPVPEPGERSRIPHRRAARTASLAVRLAGAKRSHLAEEWTTHLVGAPESGLGFSPNRQLRIACGFILAAMQMRAKDGVRPM